MRKAIISFLIALFLLSVCGSSLALSDLLAEYESKGISVIGVESGELERNSDYYVGKIVYTVVKVSNDPSSETLYAKAINSDAWVFKFNLEFVSEREISYLKEDHFVAFVGEVIKAEWYHLAAVAMKDCKVIAIGTEAVKIQNELAAGAVYAVAQRESTVSAQTAASKQDYIDSCKSIKYRDIERNPDKHKGERIKVSGTVIQVSEGWFDSVTLRVKDNNGDIWYVTYTREEGEDRILEDDKVNVYGKSDGVETYTTILGGSVTIPSIEAKYIDIR